MKTLTTYATRIDLPNDLLERIQRYFENDSNDQNSIEEQEILF
jgi:hypothetical protein